MAEDNLAVYINDHFAGSVAGVRLCERIRRISDDPELVRTIVALEDEVRRDQRTLDELRRTLGISRSRLRDAGAVLAQALSGVKLRVEGSKHVDVHRLHALDSLSLGIEGKKALWTALAAAAEESERLRLADYEALTRRADEQLATLRELRAAAARRAFARRGSVPVMT